MNEVFLPKVSVVVPIYNGEKDLPNLLKSLAGQTYPASLVEYLLVDNNSNDATAELLIKSVQEFQQQGLQLQVLTEKQIQSSYAARNLGIRKASGDVITFTDADCSPEAEWLEELVQPFVDLAIGIVVGEIAALPGKSLIEKYSDRYMVMSQKFLLEHKFLPYGQTANLAIRREIFSQIGLFRPYLTTGGDADICWRIQQNTHWQITFAPKAIIKHRHRNNLQDLRSQWQRYGRSNLYLHELHGADLMRELKPREIIYRLGRWILKELPKDTINLLSGKGMYVDLIKTPIDLIGFQARTSGQQTAKLPENARDIERLS